MENKIKNNSGSISGVLSVLILLIAIIVLALVILFNNGYLDEYLGYDVINGTTELSEYCEDKLESGENEFTVTLKDISEDELSEFNNQNYSFYGYMKSYAVLHNSDKGMTVNVELQESEDVAVFKALVNGQSINLNSRQQEIYAVARQVLNDNITSDMSDYDKEKALHDYIVKNTVYTEDTSSTDVYSTYGVLVNKSAVCAGYAKAFYLLTNAAGVECELVAGYAGDDGADINADSDSVSEADYELNHSWNIVKIDGDYYDVDVTWDDPTPDQGDKVSYKFFNVTDEYMSMTHAWSEDTPECNSDKYNYFVAEKKVVSDFNSLKAKIDKGLYKKKETMVFKLENGLTVTGSELSFIMDNLNVTKSSFSLEEDGEDNILTIYVSYN